MALRFHLDARPDWALKEKLGAILARHLALVDVLGRMQILRHAYKKTGRLLPIAESGRGIRFDDDDDDQIEGVAGFSFDLPDDQSGRLIHALTPVTRHVFDGLTAQYRIDAFTLAGVADVRLLEKIRNALAEVGRKGDTAATWKAEVNQLTSDAGVEALNAFTLDTAFNTAMQKAYSKGRLEQMKQPHMLAALPFWQYWTVRDDRVRPEHAVLHKFIARAIDPVWRKIYPPSGFNCRCSVAPITEAEALRMDPKAADGGLERLPELAVLLVPQRGFTHIFEGLAAA